MKKIKLLGMMYYGGPTREDFVSARTYVKPFIDTDASILLHYPENRLDIRELAGFFDAVLLSGSYSDIDADLFGQKKRPETCAFARAEDIYGMETLRAFRAAGKPILGICYGAQLVNVAFGGDLLQHIERDDRHLCHDIRAYHNTEVLPGTMLADLIGAGWHLTNSSHHQAVGRLAEGFRLCARAEDGVPEAIEGDNALALQWHPETMPPDMTCGILASFVKAARLGRWERVVRG